MFQPICTKRRGKNNRILVNMTYPTSYNESNYNLSWDTSICQFIQWWIFEGVLTKWANKSDVIKCVNWTNEPSEIETDTLVRSFVDILLQISQHFNFHQNVARFRLCVMLHQIWHDVVDQLLQVRSLRLLLFLPFQLLPLLSYFTRQMSTNIIKTILNATFCQENFEKHRVPTAMPQWNSMTFPWLYMPFSMTISHVWNVKYTKNVAITTTRARDILSPL